nr:hypothetical protein Iba_chr15eCG7400 [Ipomoea batatas]
MVNLIQSHDPRRPMFSAAEVLHNRSILMLFPNPPWSGSPATAIRIKDLNVNKKFLDLNSEHEEDTEEVRRKVEVLEWLKGVTKRLLSNEVDGEAARSTSGIAAPFSLSSAIAIASSLSP